MGFKKSTIPSAGSINMFICLANLHNYIIVDEAPDVAINPGSPPKVYLTLRLKYLLSHGMTTSNNFTPPDRRSEIS